MANTEGLTDEEMLQSVNATLKDWSSASPNQPRLVERLDRGMGQAPAAKVIRKAPQKIAVPGEGIKSYSASSIASTAATTETAPAVLGNIVERPRTRGRRRHRQDQATTNITRATPSQGFPSLQPPLGTFTPRAGSGTAKTCIALATTKPSSTDTTPSTKSNSKYTNPDNLQALKQASAKEADQILAEMSTQEIRASAEELRAMLSPDNIAFLQRRRRSKSATNDAAKIVQATQSTHDTAEEERLEKERVAKLLSSVQNYSDMDALYQAETGQMPELGKPHDDHSDNASSDTFPVACDLLRSMAPRQVLWAVRVVRDRLAQDLAKDDTSLRLPTRAKWPYPTLLPVSLRCLLDQTINRGNSFALHTHALQALHLLLRLRCAKEHDVDFSDSNAVLADDTAIYQLVFGQDAVPTHPIGSVYKASRVKPLSVGEHEHVAYATSSSSATALQDGQKFTQDPLWTLLSQMQIIPRLTALFQCGNNLPQEAWLASLGILAMVAQRAPGAASAMVQHKTLLKDVARVAWEPQNDDSGDTLSKNCIRVAAVRFWTILARQSRTAASGLEVPPWGMLLGTKQTCVWGRALPRWTLVLWRTFLRYGLQLQELEAMLTIATPHLAILRSDSGLTIDYLSCFTLVVKTHHDRVAKTVDREISRNEMRQLAQVRAWLSSCYRQALVYLEEVEFTSDLDGSDDALNLSAACLAFIRRYMESGESLALDLSGEYKTEVCTVEDDRACRNVLQRLVSNGTFCFVLDLVTGLVFQNEIKSSAQNEAVAVHFLSEFSATVSMFLKWGNDALMDAVIRHDIEETMMCISEKVLNILVEQSARKPRQLTVPSLVSLGWRNRGRFVVLELVRLTCQKERIPPAIRIAMGVSAVAWMQVGDEALLDRILRLDLIDLPLDLRSMVMTQLHSNSQKEGQLEHSKTLNHEYLLDLDVTSELQTLRSETDNQQSLSTENDASILPMGEYWLWKVLAGSSSSETPMAQIVQVLISTLAVLHKLEVAETEGYCGFSRALSDGSKMYFLLNVCLHSEMVLDEESICSLCSLLQQKLIENVDSEFVRSFADSCLEHSSTQFLENSSDDATEEEKKLAEALLEEKQNPSTDVLSSKQLRIVMDFINDLCTAFCDYGAQYPVFGCFFRVFLYPAFPPKIRCEVLRRLQGLLHLVFLPEEEKEDQNAARLLSKFLAFPHLDGDTLDTLAKCFSKSSPNRPFGLVWEYAIAALAMALHCDARKGKLQSQRHRLEGLHTAALARVAHLAHRCISEKPGTPDVSDFVLLGDRHTPPESMTWEQVVEMFQS